MCLTFDVANECLPDWIIFDKHYWHLTRGRQCENNRTCIYCRRLPSLLPVSPPSSSPVHLFLWCLLSYCFQIKQIMFNNCYRDIEIEIRSSWFSSIEGTTMKGLHWRLLILYQFLVIFYKISFYVLSTIYETCFSSRKENAQMALVWS